MNYTVFEYADDVWPYVFAHSLEEKRDNIIHVLHQLETLLECLNNLNEFPSDIAIRHVLLDKEYLTWLNGRGTVHSSLERTTYADHLTDDDVTRLWHKHKRGHIIQDYVHFVVLEGENIPYANFPISYTSIHELTRLYGHYFNTQPGHIYIHPELQCPDFFLIKYRHYLIEDAQNRMQGRLPTSPKAQFPSRAHHANVASRVIPIGVKLSTGPIYSAEDLLEQRERLNRPMSSDLSNAVTRLDVEHSSIHRVLPAVCLVSGTDVMAAANLIVTEFRRQAQREGQQFRVE